MRIAHATSRVPLTISGRGISLGPGPAVPGIRLPAGRGATSIHATSTHATSTHATSTHDANPVATSKLSKV